MILPFFDAKMMPGNFQNMSGPGLGPQGLQQQAGQQRGSAQIQHHVYRMIQQQQQIPQGWQTMVGIQQRALNAYQLYVNGNRTVLYHYAHLLTMWCSGFRHCG